MGFYLDRDSVNKYIAGAKLAYKAYKSPLGQTIANRVSNAVSNYMLRGRRNRSGVLGRKRGNLRGSNRTSNSNMTGGRRMRDNSHTVHTAQVGEYVDKIPPFVHYRHSKMKKLIAISRSRYPNLTLSGKRPFKVDVGTGQQSVMAILLDTRLELNQKFNTQNSLKANVTKSKTSILADTSQGTSTKYVTGGTFENNATPPVILHNYPQGQIADRHFIDEFEYRDYFMVNNSNVTVKVTIIEFYYTKDTNLNIVNEFLKNNEGNNKITNVNNSGTTVTNNYTVEDSDRQYMVGVVNELFPYKSAANTGDPGATLANQLTSNIPSVNLSDTWSWNVVPDLAGNLTGQKNGNIVGCMPWKSRTIRDFIKFKKNITKYLGPAGKLKFSVQNRGKRVVDMTKVFDAKDDYLSGWTRGIMIIASGQLVSTGGVTESGITYSSATLDVMESIYCKLRPTDYIPNQKATFSFGAPQVCTRYATLSKTSELGANGNTMVNYASVYGDNYVETDANCTFQGTEGEATQPIFRT